MPQKKINHRRRARRAWRHLVRAARERRRLTYGEIASELGLHYRSVRWFLGEIQREMDHLDLPPIQALVYNKGTRAPGPGYDATERDGRAYWKAVKRVFAYDWPGKAPF